MWCWLSSQGAANDLDIQPGTIPSWKTGCASCVKGLEAVYFCPQHVPDLGPCNKPTSVSSALLPRGNFVPSFYSFPEFRRFRITAVESQFGC